MADPQQLALLLDPPRACRNPSLCVDCRVHVHLAGEYYMVRDDVWPIDPDGGQLCVGCLEKRIGRRLVPGDFIDAPVNRPGSNTSARLADRLGFARASLFEEAPAG